MSPTNLVNPSLADTFRTLVIPLLTIGASGVVAGIVTFRLNSQLQRRELLRTKLEEAYGATHDYCDSLGNYFLKYFAVFKGEIDIDGANDLTIKAAASADQTAYRRLEMLLRLYVPVAEPSFHQLVTLRGNLNSLVGAHRQRYLRGEGSTTDLIPALNVGIAEIDVHETAIKDRIVEMARQL